MTFPCLVVFAHIESTDSFSEEEDDDFQIADDNANNPNEDGFNQDEMRNLHIDGKK